MDLIDRIFALMDKESVTAAQLTREVPLTNGVVTQWKQRKQKPSLDAVIRLADYFNKTTDYLLTGKESDITNDAAIKKERVVMNENARNNLKRLTVVFKYFRDLAKESDPFSEFNNRDYKLVRDKVIDELSELGMTADILHEWGVSNFDNPPTIQQLNALLCIMKNDSYGSLEMSLMTPRVINDYDDDIASSDDLFPGFIESCETAINDYRYYIESDSRNKAQKATEDEINIKANNA